jgi:2'-5' RNA ligase
MTQKKFFIGVPLQEPAVGRVEQLRADIERTFTLPQTKRIPAHLTLVPPFLASELQVHHIDAGLRRLASVLPTFSTLPAGFGSFPTHTHFIDLHPSKGLKAVKYILREIVQDQGCSLPQDFGDDRFHVSVAVDVPTPELHAEIGAYLATRDAPTDKFLVQAFRLYVRGPDRWEERVTVPLLASMQGSRRC